MGKLTAYNFITLNGYFEGPNRGDISWHPHSAEETAFAVKMLKKGNVLVFGRVTYEMMASYWPTKKAIEEQPKVAEGMNKARKIVFSKSINTAVWKNTKVINGDILDEIKKLKKKSSRDMTILGSGSIITLLSEHRLIDEYQILLDPVAIPGGTPIFKGVFHELDLKLKSMAKMKNGGVLLTYVTKSKK